MSGNPKGRPKGTFEYAPDFRKFRPFSDEMVEGVINLARGFRTVTQPGKAKRTETVAPTISLMAMQFVIERAWGKSPQAINVSVNDVTERDSAKEELEALEFVRSRINSIAARIEKRGDAEVVDIEAGEQP